MSDFQYDATGVDLSPKFRKAPLPEGVHTFRITSAKASKSKSGYNMVEVEAEVINDIDLMGRKVKHWVTFLAPEREGAGMAIHFLKVIGQPWEGKFDVNAADWKGGTFKGKVKHEPYTSKKDGNTYTREKLVGIDYSEEKKEPEIPF